MNNAVCNDPIMLALKEKLLRQFSNRIRRILLFGSRARGDFDSGSDYDLMILVDKAEKEFEDRIYQLAWDFGFENNVSVSLLVFEQTLFDRDRYEPLFINVRREGAVV